MVRQAGDVSYIMAHVWKKGAFSLTNLVVPAYQFISDKVIVIGVDTSET